MRDYTKIKISFISKDIIEKEAEKFRKKYWNNIIPVEMEDIIELRMGIEIIPVPGLKYYCDTDAFISGDWSSMRMDKKSFEDERYKNRLRFSMAHELGHFALHKEIYESFQIKELEDFYKLIAEIPGNEYGKIETQANMFASALLLPAEILSRQRKRLLKEKSINEKDFEKGTLNAYLAGSISGYFGVSEEAARIALDNL